MERRAYTVRLPDGYDEGGGTIFACSNIEARRIAADEWCDGELRGLSVVREPGFDQYRETGVPARVLVGRGWWFECYGCDMRISEDDLAENDMRIEDVIGTERSAVYCCVECRDEAKARAEREKTGGEAFLARLRKIVIAKYGPEANFEGVRDHIFAREEGGCVVIRQAIVEFRFPGQKIGSASLRYEWGHTPECPQIGPPAPQVFCPTGDLEAFKAWAGAA